MHILVTLADNRKATKNITSTLCGIKPRDHSHIIGILGTTGGALAVTAVVLRCISRFKSLGGGFWWDDWTIIFATVCAAIPLL
jgi:hypothetical protein